jgi:alanine dehydrogenase
VGQLTIGVIARSRKENERRLPIHPAHIERITPGLRQQIFLEHGYGEPFGITDRRLADQVGGLHTRAELLANCDVVLLPRPLTSDLAEMRDGQVLWGWPHCVQNEDITQIGIDRRLTMIAFEAMHHRSADGSFRVHVFHKNNELAGYCSVLHALQLTGITGEYGRPLRAVVISFGATGRGAVTALNALGVNDVHVLTRRDVTAVASPIHSARMVHFARDARGSAQCFALPEGRRVPLAAFLGEFDIVVNCVLQDPTAPMMFITRDNPAAFAPGSLIVDVSCDAGMGFSWARPTSFTDPMFAVQPGLHYYAVDHSPSLLWKSATWELSEALLPHLATVVGGPDSWDRDPVIGHAFELRHGVIQNPVILSFQHRAPEYPHPRSADPNDVCLKMV